MTLSEKGNLQNKDEDYPFLDMSLVDASEVSTLHRISFTPVRVYRSCTLINQSACSKG